MFFSYERSALMHLIELLSPIFDTRLQLNTKRTMVPLSSQLGEIISDDSVAFTHGKLYYAR